MRVSTSPGASSTARLQVRQRLGNWLISRSATPAARRGGAQVASADSAGTAARGPRRNATASSARPSSARSIPTRA